MAAQRKLSIVQVLLGGILLTLLVFKSYRAVTPVTLFPQEYSQAKIAVNEDASLGIQGSTQATVQTTAEAIKTATPVQKVCSLDSPAGAAAAPPGPVAALEQDFSKVKAACSGADGFINAADFVIPDCAAPGGKCAAVAATSVSLNDTPHIGDVKNYIENLGNGYYNQYSNSSIFTYQRNGDGTIRLLQDTIWGGGPANDRFVCDGTKDEAFYRKYELEDKKLVYGGHQYNIQSVCDSKTISAGYLKPYKKILSNGAHIESLGAQAPTENLSGLQACVVTGQSDKLVASTNRLIFHGEGLCNGVSMDMIAFLVDSGAGKAEVSFYGKNKGLVAWYQQLDFSKPENLPTTWLKNKTTDLCKLGAKNTKATTQKSLPGYFEYNLQRQCGQTSEKVLNNFLDEYSVTCLPRAAYILDVIGNDNCGLTAKGCSNWNTTGELKLTTDNALFGLFRDEAKASARSTGGDNLQTKDRRESIEAFFTGKLDNNQLEKSEIKKKVDPTLLDTYQAPLYKNSTVEQQCRLIYNKLKTVKELCDPVNRIEGDKNAECAINQFLPGKTTRYLDVLNTIKSEENCAKIMDTPASADILSVDPAMEVAYRPAFVVMATLVNDHEHAGNPLVNAPNTDGKPFWQVDYMELKVPSFGSDFLNTNTTKSISNPSRPGGTYTDPLRFTADSIVSVEDQEKYRKEEEDERNQIRAVAKVPAPQGAIEPGKVIGEFEQGGTAPIKCRGKDSVSFSEGNCDNIARALVSFINASVALKVDPKSIHRTFTPTEKWIPSETNKCEVDENDMYANSQNPATGEEFQVAEEAQTLGSKLAPQSIGQYDKKTSATTNLEAIVPSMMSPPGHGSRIATTRVFYISPHQYTLMYARNAAMSLLTLDEQKQVLKDPNFTSVLKAGGVDDFKNDKTVEDYLNPVDNTHYQTSIQIQREKNGEVERKTPIMWQTAASVANLFTREFALATTTLESKTHIDTLKCTGPNATEHWLQNRCSPEGTTPIPDDVSPEALKSDLKSSDKCIPVHIKDKAEQKRLADVVRKVLPTPVVKDFFWRWAGRPTTRKQHIFETEAQCDNKPCYDYLMDRIIAETDINPQLVIAMAFNESNGLINNNPKDPNDNVGTHFGCGSAGKIFFPGVIINGKRVGEQTVGSQTIKEKFKCMVDTFEAHEELSDDAELRRYGYSSGWKNYWLSYFIDIFTAGDRANACPAGDTPDANTDAL